MRKVGNVASNQIYNPENKRAPVPVDTDEADSAMERFIRQKYIHNVASQASESSKPGSPRSREGTPPPLPPKNTSKFGFRSASSIFPLSSKARKEARAKEFEAAGGMPALANKQSKVFGTTVGSPTNDTELKLQKLNELGFLNAYRNEMVLKGVNGNLDQAVESLMRLGEGYDKPLPMPGQTVPKLRATKSFTPTTKYSSPTASEFPMPKRRETDRPTTASTTSTNPYDALNRAQPQTAQSTGSLPNANPYQLASSNPFAGMTSPTQNYNQGQFEQAFQDLSVSPQPQSAPFGLTMALPTQPTQSAQPAYSQSVPTSPNMFPDNQFVSLNATAYAQNWQQAPLQAQPTGTNPFFSQSVGSAMPQTVQYQSMPVQMTGTQQQLPSPNPFFRAPMRMASSPALGQIPEMGQSAFMTASPQPLASPSNNPFFTPPTPQSAPPSQPLRHDKAAIMALYGQPSPHQAAFSPGLQSAVIPEHQAVDVVTLQPAPSRSVSQPLPNNNPYMNSASLSNGASDPYAAAQRKISRESMNLGKDMAWANGRHSPDAFASLSASHA